MKKLIRITTIPDSLGLIKGQAKFMSSKGYEVLAVSSPGSQLDAAAQRDGVRTAAVRMTRTISPMRDLAALWQMCKLFRKEKPFIVHTHTPKAGIIGMLAAKICGVPHRLHTVAGMPLLVHTGAKRKLLDLVERLTYACATKVYPNSHKMREIILDLGFAKPDKVKVIANGSSNGIDTAHFSTDALDANIKEDIRNKYGIPSDAFVFIFVGRLVRDKGVVELVKAFRRVSIDHPHAYLFLLGPYESDLDPLPSACLEEIQNNRNIIETGYQSDVRPYFATSDALAFPSYREGFPNVVMQAGAMGLASIVTDINGCNEIIVEGENGTIIPTHNATALEQAMRNFINNREQLKSMSEKARPMIADRYEQSAVWAAILEEYRSLES